MDSTVLIAIISTLGVVSVPIAAGYFALRKTKLELKAAQKNQTDKINAAQVSIAALKSQVEVNRLLAELHQQGFPRVLIVLVQNGGKIPAVGSPLYATAIDVNSINSHYEKRILEKYNGVRVDADYISFCAQLAADNNYVHHYVVPDKEKVPDNKLPYLAGWYRDEGVKESYIHHLATDVHFDSIKARERFRMFLLSLAVYESQDFDVTKVNWAEVNRLVNEIRKRYHKFYSHVEL